MNFRTSTTENHKRSPLKPWKKGPTRGRGRPQDATCEYKGARQRTWVAEIREPKNRTRLWLGSFATAEEVAMIRLQGDSRVQILISIFLIYKPMPIQEKPQIELDEFLQQLGVLKEEEMQKQEAAIQCQNLYSKNSMII
ncbi:hypothetical protein FEM48_Zijuj12G0092800 [Ziziphus jujuba var. spinosa]|uniref:AP2/ERF domain-containing protein n=1 Tax=Ziziphus jujuba var. spinosa TaxID=714518 RepID=A0A978UCG4_ZIZJJ|nr:hypothetical protein FEM48_Zijuj12G0092800 [Ziziphus jujuba var. spinosa]